MTDRDEATETEPTVLVERDGPVMIVSINRPERRNAVDRATANLLYAAFLEFDADDSAAVAVLTGVDGVFCAGADLKAFASGGGNRVEPRAGSDIVGSLGPMGPTRLDLSKPVIAAIEGWAVAGGLELAAWCDMRVAAEDAAFGVFCRRWGVPLVDGGTVRLPRLVGHSHAMDLILTGREVRGAEAAAMGLANRVVEPGSARSAAIDLAHELAALPQNCMRSDRRSAIDQWSSDLGTALSVETAIGLETINTGETIRGATRFSDGAGRHGAAAPE
ncbi:MAG: crotonase/enoyl-CoA hydratase family protein [Actinomycetota bacterium]